MSEEIKPATLSKAFVTGGSGFLGRHLIRRLRSDGIKCVAIARSVRAGQLVETEGAEAVMGDVLDAEALARGMAGCDVVFHCACQRGWHAGGCARRGEGAARLEHAPHRSALTLCV